MTYFVPDFELDEERISLASTPLRHKVIDSSNEAFAELVWRNGPAVHQLHSPLPDGRYAAADAGCGGGGGGSLWLTAESPELFMEEDEMAMWLDSQMEDNHGGGNLYSELLHPLPGADGRAQERQQPLPLPPLTTERRQRVLGSGEFETVVSSEESPEVAEAAGRVLEKGPVRAPLEDWGPRACDRELGSSSGADEGIGLKRKARESLVPECHSEDVEFEDGNRRKDTRHSSSTRRTRAAEVHNLSERRRRDRINERMKALQDLIPRCNKSDKASMLDDAIEYLKSLQLQVQHAWGPPACL